MWSGNWKQCQAAVDSVLNGIPITQHSSSAPHMITPPLNSYDMRHLPKNLNRVPTRTRFNRPTSVDPDKVGEPVNGTKTQPVVNEDGEVGLELSLGPVPQLVPPGEANKCSISDLRVYSGV